MATTTPLALPFILHVGARDAYPWETPDIPEQGPASPGLILQGILSRPDPEGSDNLKRPNWGCGTTHLYSKEITIPIPSLDVTAKRLAMIEEEEKILRAETHRRLAELSEKRERLLSLPAPGEGE